MDEIEEQEKESEAKILRYSSKSEKITVFLSRISTEVTPDTLEMIIKSAL